ncbi:MAG: lipoprotein-releasing system ATP-binding protein, partial [Candidatus Azotimanducaceae bacterium]
DLHQLFAQLSKEMGYTIVVVTHNEKLAAMADRTLHMQDGNILG